MQIQIEAGLKMAPGLKQKLDGEQSFRPSTENAPLMAFYFGKGKSCISYFSDLPLQNYCNMHSLRRTAFQQGIFFKYKSLLIKK